MEHIEITKDEILFPQVKKPIEKVKDNAYKQIILFAYDPDQEHKVITEASEASLCYILLQLHAEGKCIFKKNLKC